MYMHVHVHAYTLGTSQEVVWVSSSLSPWIILHTAYTTILKWAWLTHIIVGCIKHSARIFRSCALIRSIVVIKCHVVSMTGNIRHVQVVGLKCSGTGVLTLSDCRDLPVTNIYVTTELHIHS